MAKEKVNYQEVYDLYQLCSETKDLREFCADYGVNYDKFMNWQRHQLWSEKLGKTVQVEQPKVAKVRITGKPCNSPTVKLEVKQPEGESPIKWVKLQLTSGATLFLRNTTVLDLSLLLSPFISLFFIQTFCIRTKILMQCRYQQNISRRNIHKFR